MIYGLFCFHMLNPIQFGYNLSERRTPWSVFQDGANVLPIITLLQCDMIILFNTIYQLREAYIRFPTNGFTFCLTLSSEFFSTFAHATCSLSVSHITVFMSWVMHTTHFHSALSSKVTHCLCDSMYVLCVCVYNYGTLTLYDHVHGTSLVIHTHKYHHRVHHSASIII